MTIFWVEAAEAKPGVGYAPALCAEHVLGWELVPCASSGGTTAVVLLWYAAEATVLASPRGFIPVKRGLV